MILYLFNEMGFEFGGGFVLGCYVDRDGVRGRREGEDVLDDTVEI